MEMMASSRSAAARLRRGRSPPCGRRDSPNSDRKTRQPLRRNCRRDIEEHALMIDSPVRSDHERENWPRGQCLRRTLTGLWLHTGPASRRWRRYGRCSIRHDPKELEQGGARRRPLDTGWRRGRLDTMIPSRGPLARMNVGLPPPAPPPLWCARLLFTWDQRIVALVISQGPSRGWSCSTAGWTADDEMKTSRFSSDVCYTHACVCFLFKATH